MRWRRFVLFAVLLVVVASLVSAMAPRDRRSGDSRNELPPSNPPAAVVEGALPGKDVRARVGDVVRLLVRAPSSDVVQLSSLALEEPVDADQPAELVFVADRAGRFPVRLRDAGEAIGTLRVTSRAPPRSTPRRPAPDRRRASRPGRRGRG